MSKPYDSVFKDLLERDPAGWVHLALGPIAGNPVLVDSDISTVSGAADKVVLMDRLEPFLVHFEAFASWDPTITARAMNYNALHHRRHLLPVDTVMVILRPEADHSSLTGEYRVTAPVSGKAHSLEYGVLRAWNLDLETVLQGSLGTLPLAPLTDAASDLLPQVLRRMEDRLEAEASPEERKDLWADTFVLLGLRYSRQSVAQLFRGIPAMRESDTYQAILEEGLEQGELRGAIRSLLLVGRPRLGEPDDATRRRIENEASLAQVERWLSRASMVESWSDLTGSGA